MTPHTDTLKEWEKGSRKNFYKKVVGKSQVHKWLVVRYGNPKICEGKDCRGNATWYDWALKHGKEYERKKSNFFRLCRSCHRRYDLTFEKKMQAVNNLWWRRGIKCPGVPNFKHGNKWASRLNKTLQSNQSK